MWHLAAFVSHVLSERWWHEKASRLWDSSHAWAARRREKDEEQGDESKTRDKWSLLNSLQLCMLGNNIFIFAKVNLMYQNYWTADSINEVAAWIWNMIKKENKGKVSYRDTRVQAVKHEDDVTHFLVWWSIVTTWLLTLVRWWWVLVPTFEA